MDTFELEEEIRFLMKALHEHRNFLRKIQKETPHKVVKDEIQEFLDQNQT